MDNSWKTDGVRMKEEEKKTMEKEKNKK